MDLMPGDAFQPKYVYSMLQKIKTNLTFKVCEWVSFLTGVDMMIFMQKRVGGYPFLRLDVLNVFDMPFFLAQSVFVPVCLLEIQHS